VHVVREATVVDVHHTARTGLATGIQRVVRKTIDEWVKDRELVLVGWGPGYGGLRELSSAERENALYGTQAHADRPRQVELTVPWRSRYILPELAIETERTARIACLAEFSGNSTAMIGFDCVPLTSAETVAAGMGAAFARNLVAAAQFDKIGTISAAAATEYGGWATMQASAGISGPEVREVLLPFEAGEVTDAQLAEFSAVLLTGDLPMLLCVGSHEPRKNHMAVLHAAETLWRKGREFSVVFIGGNSWGSDPFRRQLATLQKAGRPVQSISAVSDELLWSAYRLARGTVFPSWNEGFGLPVAESIAAGTPVVTSNFGSMKEIAAGGGAVLADPRDDDDIIRALDLMLFDDEVNARLRVESRSRPLAEWPDYAGQLWDYFSGTA
jgi:glycosyltransferase involved in cell wall biosynthesis